MSTESVNPISEASVSFFETLQADSEAHNVVAQAKSSLEEHNYDEAEEAIQTLISFVKENTVSKEDLFEVVGKLYFEQRERISPLLPLLNEVCSTTIKDHWLTFHASLPEGGTIKMCFAPSLSQLSVEEAEVSIQSDEAYEDHRVAGYLELALLHPSRKEAFLEKAKEILRPVESADTKIACLLPFANYYITNGMEKEAQQVLAQVSAEQQELEEVQEGLFDEDIEDVQRAFNQKFLNLEGAARV